MPFFSIAGSEFVEMFGPGCGKGEDLEQAKESPCIALIDEIDTIGKRRDGGINTNDERSKPKPIAHRNDGLKGIRE